jgi:RHS repeat-associated protein
MPGREFSQEEYRYGFNGMEKDEEFKGEGNSYDFGARMYDARIGRWLSVDSKSSEYESFSPYGFVLNSPLKYIDGNGEFVIDPSLAKKYPKVALVLENAYALYYGLELSPELIESFDGVDIQQWFNDNVKEQFKSHSGLNKQQIDEMLINGSGPLVTEQNLTRVDPVTGEDIPINGKTYPKVIGRNIFDSNFVNEEGIIGKIGIHESILQVLEYTLDGEEIGGGFAGTTRSNKEMNNKAFGAFVSTLMHEGVHYGRFISGVGNLVESEKGETNDTNKDPVKQYEIDAYGSDIERVNKTDLKND